MQDLFSASSLFMLYIFLFPILKATFEQKKRERNSYKKEQPFKNWLWWKIYKQNWNKKCKKVCSSDLHNYNPPLLRGIIIMYSYRNYLTCAVYIPSQSFGGAHWYDSILSRKIFATESHNSFAFRNCSFALWKSQSI